MPEAIALFDRPDRPRRLSDEGAVTIPAGPPKGPRP